MPEAITCPFISLRDWDLTVERQFFPSSPLIPAELEASHEPALTCHFSLLWFSNRFLKNSSVVHWLTHLGFMCLWRQYSHRSSFPEHSLVWRLVCKKFTREALVGAWRKQDQTQLNCGPFSTKASAHSTEALMLGVLFTEFCWKAALGPRLYMFAFFGHWTEAVPGEEGVWSWGGGSLQRTDSPDCCRLTTLSSWRMSLEGRSSRAQCRLKAWD